MTQFLSILWETDIQWSAVNTDTKVTWLSVRIVRGMEKLGYTVRSYVNLPFFLNYVYNQPRKKTCSSYDLEGELGRFNSYKRENSAM